MKVLFVFCAMILLQSMYGQQFSALLFTRTEGWHHESIKEGVESIIYLGQKHHFKVEWQENASWFTDEKLKQYDVIIFLNTTGDILNAEQQLAMEKFIKSGKGFVGIHAAADTEYDWEWYTKLVGRMFRIHPQIQTAYLQKLNTKFPNMDNFKDYHMWTDEWYEYGPETVKGLNYILSVDEKSFDPKADWGRISGVGMGSFHPIAWYHDYDGGRSFYTGLGHLPALFQDYIFQEHLYGGILWAAKGKGIKP